MGAITSPQMFAKGGLTSLANKAAKIALPVVSPAVAALEKSPVGKALAKVAPALGPLVGVSGGANGTGYAKPIGTDIQQGVQAPQITSSYTNAQNSLDSQQRLLAALQAQQGLQAQQSALGRQNTLADQLSANHAVANQGAVFNQGQGLANQLAVSNGIGNQSSALHAQQALANQQQQTAQQYQNIANGNGPNPAQAALNQSTGQNIAAQAALMAGQRGASSNVGLLARQSAQQGAATQQQAVGQGATMQAQQELNALSGLSQQQQAIGGTQQNVANIANQQVGETQAQQQALAAQAAQQVGQQQNQQTNIANQANALAGQQIGATNTNAQTQQSEQQILQNALANQNQQNVSMQGNINSVNAGLATTNMQGQQKVIGGLMQGIGAGGQAASTPAAAAPAAAAAGAEGGMIHQSDTGANFIGPQSSFGKFVHGYAKGGSVQSDYRSGGDVEAKDKNQKAVKSGNSYANDKIPAVLSEGEVVIPRSVMQGKDPARGAAEFVAKVLAKKGKRA